MPPDRPGPGRVVVGSGTRRRTLGVVAGGRSQGTQALKDIARRVADRVAGHRQLRSAMVSLEFDDGYRSALTNALPAIEERGWSATQFLVSGTPDAAMESEGSPIMSTDEVLEWASRAEVGSHSVTHRRLTELDDGQVADELRRSRDDLEDLLGRRVELFAAPFGTTDHRVSAEARRTYRHQRLLGGAVNVARGFDPWSVRSLAPKSTTPLDELAAHLAVARRRRGWLVLCWHRVGEDLDSPWNVGEEAFRAQLDLIADSGIEVVSTAEALDRFEQAARSAARAG